jgi:uncharacterized cysteine cluster protein YcgN (CxxCxxCC family)
MTDQKWNRCDVCGRFIALGDFERGAVRNLVYPDSDRTVETWETLCPRHGQLCISKAMGGEWCVGRCGDPRDCTATPRSA